MTCSPKSSFISKYLWFSRNRNGKFYGFNKEPNRLDLFLHLINTILHPVALLNSIDRAQSFFNDYDEQWDDDYMTPFFKTGGDKIPDIRQHYKDLKYKTRVIAFVHDPKEYA